MRGLESQIRTYFPSTLTSRAITKTMAPLKKKSDGKWLLAVMRAKVCVAAVPYSLEQAAIQQTN